MKRYIFLALITGSTYLCAQPTIPARLASWPAKVEQTGAFYALVPQMYPDKVSVQETAFNGFNNVLYTVLEDVMPPHWYPVMPKVTINHLDASDALVLSALIPNAAIMQEALRMMGTSKAFEKCEQPLTVRLDATQAVVLLADTLIAKINRCRLVKLFTPAGLIALYATNNSTIKVLQKIATWLLAKGTFPFATDKKIEAPNTNVAIAESVVDLTCAATKLACAQYSQNKLLREGLACYRQLIQTTQVTIDRTVLKKCLTNIANKLTLFDSARTYASQYQELANQCI